MEYNIFVLFSLLMLFQYYRSNYEQPIYINAIFVAMWVIFSIEFYTTRDYYIYYEGFTNAETHKIWEPLYVFLIEQFSPLGFKFFNACVAAFEIYTLSVIFKKAIPPKYIWVGILILLLHTSNLFLFMNWKRQFFAMMVAFWIIYFLLYSSHKYRYLFAIATYLCAINIHSSAIISIAYFALPFINKRIGKTGIGIFIALFVISFSFRLSSLAEMLVQFIGMTYGGDDRYSIYISEIEGFEEESVVRGIIYQSFDLFVFVLLLIYNNRFSDTQYKLVLCSLLSYVLLNFLVGNIARLNAYFSIFNLLAIPILIFYINEDKKKWLYIAVLLASLLPPAKSYYNAMSGTKITYMTAKYSEFYSILDNYVVKRVPRAD